MLREYAKETSVHGIQYVLKAKNSLLDRVIWLVVIAASLVCTVALCRSMVVRYFSGRTVTQVKDTHYPIYLTPFPGVSICPTDKIKRGTAYRYIYQKLNVTEDDISNNSVDHFLSAMVLFQHLSYSRMMEHLQQCEDILPQLARINLTDFMVAVLPKCDEVFASCSWHGMTENCCEIFHIQRSEEGFCYSFNSFTSQRLKGCREQAYNDHVEIEDIQKDTECMLRRTSAAGPTTGLEVFLQHFDTSQYMVNWSTLTGESGVKIQAFSYAAERFTDKSCFQVQLHTSDEYPEAGMGVLVLAKSGIKMTTTIKAYLTESLEAVRFLPMQERNCYFPDETRLIVAAQYTQRSCLIQCRLNYFHQVCGCHPYHFNMLDNVKFYHPPTHAHLRGFTPSDLSTPLNCSKCLPTCHESYYDDDTDLTTDTQHKALETFGYLDLYYKHGGAVYYQRDVTFGWLDLLVGIGGTAGLFLGISLLSVVEILYWIVKMVWFCECKKDTTCVVTSLPRGLVYNKEFY
ncbi:LOW QUALITY PROTEIN: sodium channel protein Nach-like [Homalodisca vitripennis]|uniref:LOW QUALITY PROTEIN: sodium channel protein Nach-like n=1 Tax=Homalodisca vitripennis TaxID=197043 RepID=UPI001EEA2DAD|nr:LOW QUALITY PROTEIN: sodium channel protein Nach-like [Homalodisca vitripennis]